MIIFGLGMLFESDDAEVGAICGQILKGSLPIGWAVELRYRWNGFFKDEDDFIVVFYDQPGFKRQIAGFFGLEEHVQHTVHSPGMKVNAEIGLIEFSGQINLELFQVCTMAFGEQPLVHAVRRKDRREFPVGRLA